MAEKAPLLETGPDQPEGHYAPIPSAPVQQDPIKQAGYGGQPQQAPQSYQAPPPQYGQQYNANAVPQTMGYPPLAGFAGAVVYAAPVVFGPVPVHMTCPNCRYQGFTTIQKVEGNGHTTCCCLSCLGAGLIGVCCFFALCAEDYKDSRHHCPRCNVVVGVFEKSAC